VALAIFCRGSVQVAVASKDMGWCVQARGLRDLDDLKLQNIQKQGKS
jgi:hypothetical protein